MIRISWISRLSLTDKWDKSYTFDKSDKSHKLDDKSDKLDKRISRIS